MKYNTFSFLFTQKNELPSFSQLFCYIHTELEPHCGTLLYSPEDGVSSEGLL